MLVKQKASVNPMSGELSADVLFERVLPEQASALFKHVPEDFIVEETLPFDLTGAGEHLYLQVRKCQRTTLEVRDALARWAGVKSRAVYYSGLKDKWALTTQWFSVHLPGKTTPSAYFDYPGCEVLQSRRHVKKLSIGAHKFNRFTVRLTQLDDLALLEENLQWVREHGVPNYFGEQRFGYQRKNLLMAKRCLLDGQRVKPFQKKMYLSAVRSYLFNCLLSTRVVERNWNVYIAGDILQLAGTHSMFSVDQWDAVLQQRLDSADIHLTGPLAGEKEGQKTLPMNQAMQIEESILDLHQEWVDYLKNRRVKAQRRSLRLLPMELSWQQQEANAVVVSFLLPRGSFATALLRELIKVPAPLSYQQL